MVEQRFPTGAVFPQIPATGLSQQIQQVDVFKLACTVNAGSRIDRLDAIVSLGTASGEVASIWVAYGENVVFLKTCILSCFGLGAPVPLHGSYVFFPIHQIVALPQPIESPTFWEHSRTSMMCLFVFLFYHLFSCGLYGCVFSACAHVTVEHAVKHLSSPL